MTRTQNNASPTCSTSEVPARRKQTRTHNKKNEQRFPSLNIAVGRVLGFLLCLATILGFLPEGRNGIREQTWIRKLLTRLMASITAIACLFFLPVHEYYTWNLLSEKSFMYFLTEFAFGFLPTMAAWMTVITFWMKRREFIFLLDRLHQVSAGDLNIVKLSFEILCIIGYVTSCSKLTFQYFSEVIDNIWIFILGDLSFTWVVLCMISPGIFYTTLGSILSKSFTATNKQLQDILTQDQEANTETLHPIYKQFITLRMIHDDFVSILAPPLLGLCMFSLYGLTINLFFLLMQFMNGVKEPVQDTTSSTIFAIMTVIIFASIGRTADSITQEASASVQLLTHGKPRNIAADQHLRTDKPVTFAIYKLCSQPLTTEVCGFFTLSRSTFLNVLHVSATYLVIFMQFRLLEDPRSFSKKESGEHLNHSITSNLELYGNETESDRML